ncbi:hypothetical protein [Rubrivirga sp. IMCC43871]|uniref:hypothetical protein n=1 Tax=Rubrivirga sp. IMCC43871 TaxID=3391575 RepID=UPI00398F9073
METRLPPDFTEFLSSLNAANVDYLLVGGSAVGLHGYARVTGDIDLWIRQTPQNADRVVAAIRLVGFEAAGLDPSRFLGDGKITRMGLPPHRTKVMTSIDGVTFEERWAGRIVSEWDGVPVPVIDPAHLRQNKRASGRAKDLADLDEFPEAGDD